MSMSSEPGPSERTRIDLPRPIDQILVHGPISDYERIKLNRYNQSFLAFCDKHFRHIKSATSELEIAVERAISQAKIDPKTFQKAVMVPHRHFRMLKTIADKAMDLLSKKIVVSSKSEMKNLLPTYTHRSRPKYKRPVPIGTRLIGFGGFAANACQICNELLTSTCYSKTKNAKRVPRNNKICNACFHRLSKAEKNAYQKYSYACPPEPEGTGWNPLGEWGS